MVWQYEDGFRGDHFFECLDSFGMFVCPDVWAVFLGKVVEWSGEFGKVADEGSLVTDNAEEFSYFLDAVEVFVVLGNAGDLGGVD